MNQLYINMALKYIKKYPRYTIHEIDYCINNKQEGSRFIGRQLFDLVDKNLIKPTGIKTCSLSGNKSITWKIK